MAEKNTSSSGLTEEAATLQAILQSAVDAIITIDGKGIIQTANPAAERIFGYEHDDFIGQNVSFLMPEPYQSAHDDYMHAYHETGRAKIIGFGREVTGLRKNGSTFPLQLAVSKFQVKGETYFSGIIHDLSDHKATEIALRQAQKMESMGQLTGGIAHDFNNLLTVIIGNLEMLEMRLEKPNQRELAEEALEAAELGAKLTSRLLAFARRSHLEPQVVNLNTFVLGLTDLLYRTLGETIYLSNALTPDLWKVRVDPSQVETAIVNLAVNARDAMPNGGRLVIETRNARVDQDYIGDLDPVEPGDYVRLSVSDTGSGMPEWVQEKAFDPFFTTKEKGRGTGLGLSMIYGFARQSGGHAAIYSEIDKGTTVHIYLPRYLSDEEKAVEAEPEEETAQGGSGQLILAVEDDARLRRLTVSRLQQLGYRVVEAPSAKEALDILEDYPDVELLFTDLVMPGGMNGYELCEEARQLYPGLKALLTSGYAEELVRPESLEAANLKLLRKPYRLADLAKSIGEALNDQH